MESIEKRQLHNCPHCGIIADIPSSFPSLKIEIIGDKSIHIEGKLAKFKNWNAGLFLNYKLKSLNKSWTWLADQNNLPKNSLKIEDEIPAGPLEIAFVIIWNTQMALITRPTRGEYIK